MDLNGDTTRRTVVTTSALALAGCVALRGATDPDHEPGSNDGDDIASTDQSDDNWGSETDDDEVPPADDDGDDPDDTNEPADVYPPYQGRFLNRGEPIDGFEAAARWSASGKITADEEYRFNGPQSVRYEGPTGSMVLELNDTLDLGNRGLSIAAYFRHETTRVESFHVLAHAPDREHRIVYRGRYPADVGWQRYDLELIETTGAPDPSDVRAIEVRGTHPNGEEAMYHVADLRTHEQPSQGKLLFLFYGCRPNQFHDYRQVLREYGFPAVVAIHPEQYDDDDGDRLELWQLYAMVDDGWDTCLTTETDPGTLSARSFDQKLTDLRAWAERTELLAGPHAFMYPYGSYTGDHLVVLNEHVDLAFLGHGRTTNVRFSNHLTLPRFDVGQGNAAIRSVIDRAVENRSLGILRIEDELTPAEFEEIVAYAHQQGDELEVVSTTGLSIADESH